MSDPVTIHDANDPRLADYRHLRDRPLAAQSGKFVAESEFVIRKLLESALVVDSMFMTPARLTALAPVLRPEVPVYVGSPDMLEAVAGFPIHRGCLAIGRRPVDVRIPDSARLLVVLEDLVDVDNLGSMIRNAAAFGADAIVLSPSCADPFYRKAIRTSMGHVFTLPVIRLEQWPEGLSALRPRFTVLGTTLHPEARPLAKLTRPERTAVLLGTEGAGLSAAAQAACDGLITIPMSPTADSLNVGVAGAVVLYHLTQVAPTLSAAE